MTQPLLQSSSQVDPSACDRLHLQWRVGWMSFLNTLPMRHGLETSMSLGFQHYYGVPSYLNTMLLNGELDLSLVSTAAYLKHQEAWQILPSLSISSFGPVKSVLWIYRKSFDPHLHAIQCPDSSASSEALLRYILTQRYEADVLRYDVYSHDKKVQSCLQDAHNALLIGDVALRFYAEHQAGQHADLEMVDLASAWHALTGHPFLFGVWCARKSFWQDHQPVIEAWTDALVHQTEVNLSRPDLLYAAYKEKAKAPFFEESLLTAYWCKHLDYGFTPLHHDALNAMQSLL